jgi:hypothetical protein
MVQNFCVEPCDESPNGLPQKHRLKNLKNTERITSKTPIFLGVKRRKPLNVK